MNTEEKCQGKVESSPFMSHITHSESKDQRAISTSLLGENVHHVCYYSLRGMLLVSGGRVSHEAANQAGATVSQGETRARFVIIYLRALVGE